MDGFNNEDRPVSCCAACAETYLMTKDIHAAFSALSKALPALMNNPMLKTMARSFGMDVDSISTQLKG